MTSHSDQHIHLREAAAYLASDELAPDSCNASLQEMHEMFYAEPIKVPDFVPYTVKHASLLDQRNMYSDLINYSSKIMAVSVNYRSFWQEVYQRNLDLLRFIEGVLLEVESDLS